MVTIPQSQFPGLSVNDIQIRIDAFKAALASHALTVGVPAPREDDLIERLARSGEEFQLETEDGPAVVPPTFAEKRLAAVKQINDFAEQVRLKYITPGAGQAATYLIKERQAEAFKAAGYTGDVPAMVQSEVDANPGMTAQEACDLILAQRDLWEAKAAQIETERRKGVVALESVAYLDEAALSTAQNTAMGALSSL